MKMLHRQHIWKNAITYESNSKHDLLQKKCDINANRAVFSQGAFHSRQVRYFRSQTTYDILKCIPDGMTSVEDRTRF